MGKSKRERIEIIIINVLIALFVGGVSALLTRNSSTFYETIVKPPLAPPGFLFPIVWTILYVLMGISAGMIINSGEKEAQGAIRIYAFQLALNFFWSILFFRFEAFLLSFAWLVVLWITIILMIRSFYKIRPLAAYLQIPYLLWVTFAGYLNFAIYLLNR